MILDGDIKEHIGTKPVLYCPDGLNDGPIPYISSYLKPQIIQSVEELNSPSSILFSWTYRWQDIGWIRRVKQPVIIGGNHTELLAFNGRLPNLKNVNWWLGRLEGMENEPHIMPNYKVVLMEKPTIGWLTVHSGEGCYWRNCTFCNTEFVPPYKQFNPEYVAKVVSLANQYGKIGGLSAPSHTVSWLEEMESHLPNGRWYASYARADQENWRRLKKADSIYIGIEYLSDSVLRRINKGVSAQQIIDTILEILALGINVDSTVILDLWQSEEEREEHYQNTLKLIRASRFGPTRSKSGKLTLMEVIYLPPSANIYIVVDGEKITK